MIVLGIDPGVVTGMALIETTRRELLASTTERGGIPKWQTAARYVDDLIHEGWRIDLAVVQTPIMEGKTARWNKSPVSLAKNAALSGLLAGVCWGLGIEMSLLPPMRNIGAKMNPKLFAAMWHFNGTISEHARDAAQIALAGWQRWMLDNAAQKERAKA